VNRSALPAGLVPPGVVTVTSTTPAIPAGDVAVIWVADATLTPVASTVPNLTALAPVRLAPVMVTTVPPAVVPELGLTPLTAGGLRYEKTSAAVMELVPLGVVTVTSTVPVPAGAVAVMDVAEPTVKDVAATNPNRTAVAPVKAAPATVTCVPPASGPEEGLIAVTTGGPT